MSALANLAYQGRTKLWAITRPLCTQCSTSQNYYKLLGLQEKFSIDADLLSSRFKSLQRQWHPDKFGNASKPEKEKAAKMSAHLNEAYATLRTPDRRARHLLKLNLEDPTPPQLDPLFLAWVVETREEIAYAIREGKSEYLRAKKQEIGEKLRACLDAIEGAFEQHKMEEASLKTAQLQYFRRIQITIDDFLG